MGPKKDRRVRKIEVPTDSVPEFGLVDTEADIQQRGGGSRGRQEKGLCEGLRGVVQQDL